MPYKLLLKSPWSVALKQHNLQCKHNSSICCWKTNFITYRDILSPIQVCASMKAQHMMLVFIIKGPCRKRQKCCQDAHSGQFARQGELSKSTRFPLQNVDSPLLNFVSKLVSLERHYSTVRKLLSPMVSNLITADHIAFLLNCMTMNRVSDWMSASSDNCIKKDGPDYRCL